MIEIPVERLPGTEDLPYPAYATPGSSGVDLQAALAAPIIVAPGEIVLVPTGLRMAIPPGFEGQIRPRSGLAWKHGITVLNAPGTVDADYRGEIAVILINLGRESFRLERGHRIAQLVLAKVERIAWNTEAELTDSIRGGGGFGHSGA